MDQLKLPKYSIPEDLRNMLERKLEVYHWSRRAQVVAEVEEILKNTDSVDISENHYLLLLKLALYLEEYKNICDIQKNSMIDMNIKKLDSNSGRLKLFQINMGDSIGDRLFIKTGDFVDVIDVKDNYQLYSLRLTDVTQSYITFSDDDAVEFHKTYEAKKMYNIKFRFNNYRMRCAHFALWLMHERNSLTYLFPFKSKPFINDDTIVDSYNFKITNSAIKSNPEQEQAVLNIINRSSFPSPYILYGPPGTGKTTTLVEVICQLHRNFRESNILVCTPSDTAADAITRSLLLQIDPRKDIYRMYDQYRDGSTIKKKIKKYANYDQRGVIKPICEDVVSKRIIVTTLRDCMSLLLMGFGGSYFSHVIIDDAGLATEPDVLIPVSLVSKDGKLHSQIVLAGDPKHLGPNVNSTISKIILCRSMLERLMSYDTYQKDSNNQYNPKYITKLLQNYHSNPDIIHISNNLFYDNELILKCERKEKEKFAVRFYGVDGPEKIEPPSSGYGFYNAVELDLVVGFVEDLFNNQTDIGEVKAEDISIITSYDLQSTKIKEALKNKNRRYKSIKVSTVDNLRIEERKIVIMTTVRSTTSVENGFEHIGILSDAKLFNFVITRAKELLIVIGNPNVLQIDDNWRYLIQFCLDNKSYDGMDFYLDKRSIEKEEHLLKRPAVLNSLSLFDENILQLFTIDEHNPDINQLEIADLPAYNNLISNTENGYIDDNSDAKNSFDQEESKPRDIFRNVGYFDPEFIYMGTSNNPYKNRQNVVENDIFRNVESFEHVQVEGSNVLKNVCAKQTDILESNIPQSVSKKSLRRKQKKKLRDNIPQNESNSDHTALADSNDLKISHDQQPNLLEAISKNISNPDYMGLEDSSNSNKLIDKQKDLRLEINHSENLHHSDPVEFENSSVIKTLHDQQQNLLGVDVLTNVDILDQWKLEDSCGFEKPFDIQGDLMFKIDNYNNVSHPDETEIVNSSVLHVPHDEQIDLLKVDILKYKTLNEFIQMTMADRIVIPMYPIPKDLENVLDRNLDPYYVSKLSQKYIEILETLKRVKFLDMGENNYLELLKLALYLEEYQSNEDMRKYELFNRTIKLLHDPRFDPKFYIAVDDLDEEKPWIRPNDLVDITDTYDRQLYTLRVTKVTQTEIVVSEKDAKLRRIHREDKRYNIKFRIQSYPLKCAHYALESMSQSTVTYLFPHQHKFYIEKECHDYSDFEAINTNIAENPEQKQAILNIVNKSAFPAPYILYGPPGTGKTATLVEALCQICRDSSSRVLVCTPSNTAGDEITKRLLEYLPPHSIYRMYSQSRDGSTINEQIKLCSNVENSTIVPTQYEDVIRKRIVITTLCNATKLIIMKIPPDHFSHVFIDEAGQGREVDMLIPISLVSGYGMLNSQIVFAGDPHQLGPTVISKLAERILGRSILERLMSYDLYQKDSNNKYNPKYITKLLQNYRSHPDIIHVSNKLFYDDELIAKCPRSSGKENAFLCPVIFHGIQGIEEKASYSPSNGNLMEARLVIKYVDDLLKDKLGFGAVTANDIGIVTPFDLQSKLIKKALKDKQLNDINVGTVELFQGQERKVMIMTTVRSKTFFHEGKKHIGFLSNPKRFNVAITRAKNLFIIIGNPNVLQIDKNWRYLLKFCIDNNSYKGMDFSLCNFTDDRDNNVPSNLVTSPGLFKEQSLPSYAQILEVAHLMHNLRVYIDEKRPWIKSNDLIDVTDMYDKKMYILRVIKVTRTQIAASDDDRRDFERINPNIANNPEEKQAILNIVNRSSFPAPYGRMAHQEQQKKELLLKQCAKYMIILPIICSKRGTG